MSDNNQQPRPSIRIGSSPAQRRILEEETGPSSSPLTTDPASVPPSSVEASALPEASLPEGSTPKEDNSLPEDSVPMEGSSPPQDSVPVEGDNPPKDSVPSEGRSPSLVSYDDEDVEDSVAPLPPSQLGASEVPPSPLPGRSSEVPPSPSTQSRETVQPSLTTKEGLEDQPSSSSKKAIEVPSSSLPSSSEVPPSHSQQLLPAVPTVRRTIQNSAVPTSGSPLTSTVSGVNNLSVSPHQASDSIPSLSNLPSFLSEEQRKRYEQIFSDLVEYEKPPKEFSPLPQHQVPLTAPSSEIDKIPGEVSKEYIERFLQEERNWEHRKRLDREIEARRGTSSTPAQPTPSQTSSHASSSVHHGAFRQHNPYARYRDTRVIPEDPEAIPPTEMSNKRPPFYGPKVENDLGLWISPRIGPFLTDERITPETSRNDPEPTHEPRPGVRFMRTTREGVFRRFAGDEDNLFINVHNPCPYPRFSPGYNASLDILIDRDYRTGWWFTETTYGERLFLYDRRPDHIASYCGPDHRRSGNLQRALQLVTVFPGCIESRMLKWVMVEGRIEKTRLVQPAISSYQVPTQIEEIELSPEPHQREVPPSTDQPMETSTEPSHNPPMEQTEEDVVVEVSDESPTPDSIPTVLAPMEQTPAPAQPMEQSVVPPTPPSTGSTSSQHTAQPTPSTVSSSRSTFSGTYDSNLLLSSMVGSRDRDNRRRDRPKRPTLDATDLRDVDKLLKFVNKFILWSRTDRIVDEARGNIEDPAQVALASEVARLREELELARSAELASDQRFDSEPIHEWDLFRSAMRISPRGLAECVTPEALNALRYQGTGLSISSAMVPTSRDERKIWEQILRRTQFSRLDQAQDQDWTHFMLYTWIGRVLTRSTAIQDVRGLTQQMRHITIHGNPVDRLPEWEIASHVIESIGITIIRDRLLRIWSNPSHYYSDGHTLGEFFSVLQIEYENFCNARSFKEQINHVDFLYQNRISRYLLPLLSPNQEVPALAGAQYNNDEKEALLNRLPLSLMPTSNAISVNKWVIRLKGALVRTAKEAKKWREQQAQHKAQGRSSRGSGFRSRRGTRGRGRGSSSYNKRFRHYLRSFETIPPTTTTHSHTENTTWKDSLINPLANLEHTKTHNIQANFFSEQAEYDSDIIFMVQSIKSTTNCLQLNFSINNVEVKGIIDSGATCSVVTEDVIRNCNMARSNKTISYKIADGTTSQSLGTASGTLSIRLGCVTQIVHVKHKFSIVPGHETILIGADLLSHLGLMNNKGIYIRMDDACRTLLLPEAEFDHRISQASEVVNVSTRWLEHINSSGCTINLDNDHFKKSLLQTLKEFEDVFTLKPHAEGIDCPPMEINFYNEDVRVRRPPRTLNPARLEVAKQIFDELVDSGFAVPSNHEFSCPVCLVVYPDHRKPRLTGDYSGKDGVNANTIPVEPNLPRISDVLVFLSQANYIGTLDLP
ncbi:hypothetical protein P9112_013835 [Eukaryota sp. TZLM1-RC]